MQAKVFQLNKHEWEVRIGKIVVGCIYYFDKCEVQDPDEPPFVPFYHINFPKHADGNNVGNVANTLDEALIIITKELE